MILKNIKDKKMENRRITFFQIRQSCLEVQNPDRSVREQEKKFTKIKNLIFHIESLQLESSIVHFKKTYIKIHSEISKYQG